MSATRTRGRFFGELESTRGIAALLVAGFHCAQATVLSATSVRHNLWDITEPGPVWQALHEVYRVFVYQRGDQLHNGVLFFFVLSGFVLTDSLEHGPSPVGRAAGRFAIARLFRIYPAIIATVLFFALFYALTGIALSPNAYSIRSLLRNMLLLQVDIDAIMWTIQVELAAIPLIFVAFLLKRRWGFPVLVPLTVGLAITTFSGWWWQLLRPYPPFRPAWLYVFLVGMIAYYLGRELVPTLKKSTATIILISSLLVFFFVETVIHKQWGVLFRTLSGAAIVAILAFRPAVPGTAILRTSPLRFLGRVSYSFYLLHYLTVPVMLRGAEWFSAWVKSGVPIVLLAIFLWITTTAAVLPFAWLMHRTVEMPSIRFGKWLWKIAAGKTTA